MQVLSIRGSFTLLPRSGLLSQIWKTLHYSPYYNGWINKIGLRNKGLQYGIKHYNHDKDIISIAILNEKEIPKILQMLPNETNIELNISCPNVNKSLAHNKLSQFINPQRDWCIIKLSPTVDMNLVDNYYKQMSAYHIYLAGEQMLKKPIKHKHKVKAAPAYVVSISSL